MSNREQLSKSLIPSRSSPIMQQLVGTAALSATQRAIRAMMYDSRQVGMDVLLENIMVDATFHQIFLPLLGDGGLADVWLLNLLLNGATVEELLDPTSHLHAGAAGKLCFEFQMEKEGASLETRIAEEASDRYLSLLSTASADRDSAKLFFDYCGIDGLHHLPIGPVRRGTPLWNAGTYLGVVNPFIQDYHLNDSQRDGLSAKLDLINEQFNLGFITAMIAEIQQPSFAISFRHFFSTVSHFDLCLTTSSFPCERIIEELSDFLSEGGLWLIELRQKENDMRKKRLKNLKKNLKKKNRSKGPNAGTDELNVSLPVEPLLDTPMSPKMEGLVSDFSAAFEGLGRKEVSKLRVIIDRLGLKEPEAMARAIKATFPDGS
jgi:hypothetical protein